MGEAFADVSYIQFGEKWHLMNIGQLVFKDFDLIYTLLEKRAHEVCYGIEKHPKVIINGTLLYDRRWKVLVGTLYCISKSCKKLTI